MASCPEIPTPEPDPSGGIFDRQDLLTGAAGCLISFAVYVWTLAPSVTLLDSGEFLVAGQHFGVPHPTGYPLWTLLAWMFSLLPLGNAAWEINLLSGVLGALTVGLAAALSRSFLRWMYPQIHASVPGLAGVSAISAALLFAFSFSMWSQAVITEVYTLHALLAGGFLAGLYAWIRRPEREWLLFLTIGLLTLSFSNHQLAIAFAPLPLLAVLVVRRQRFWDLLVGGCVTACLLYLLLAHLSKDPLVMKAANRFGFAVAAPAAIYYFRRKWAGLRFLLGVLLAVAAGLLPYAYMPFASSTNPPMNWGYTREISGLFHSFNRSQYSGTLTDQSLRVVGKLMGVPSKSDLTPPKPKDRFAPKERTSLEILNDWTVFFGRQLVRSFTLLGALAWLVAVALCLDLRDPRRWVWVVILNLAFLLAAFLQPFLDKAGTDVAAWWLQMPYHTYTNLVFSLICALGFFRLLGWVCLRVPLLRFSRALLLLLPLLPLAANHGECSQRGHWFGWEYGHEMLRDLPPGSVMVGGSDPGRFVPTYMIFGESSQAARHKRDPGFDRRDLFILTQNALGDQAYMKYLRDQYTAARPPVPNPFERWLGRGTMYPADNLVLPTDAEIQAAIQSAARPDPRTGRPLEGNLGILGFSAVLHWIWEKNKDWHDFFIEESFPITWTYDYAIPWGLTYRLNPGKLAAIPADAVKRDFAFWNNYKNRLLADPAFLHDLDARRSFCRLRSTIGNIYRYRRMNAEAERAYREALELDPADGGTIQSLMFTQWERGEFGEAIVACEKAIKNDPNNAGLRSILQIATQRRSLQDQIAGLERKLARNPRDKRTLKALIILHAGIADLRKADEYLQGGFQMFSGDPDFLRFAAAHYELNGQPLNSLGPALRLAEIEPNNPANQFILAHSWYSHTNMPEFYKAMRAAIQAGGVPIREMFSRDSYFEPLRNDAGFRQLIENSGVPRGPEIPPLPSK